MTTILGTDGDTTGSVVAAWKTAADVTAALLAATHSAQGAMTPAEFDAVAAYLAGTVNGKTIATLQTSASLVTESFVTAKVDPAVSAVYAAIPSKPGFYFSPRLMSLVIDNGGAGASTGSLVYKWGNNAAHDNCGTQTVTLATWNAVVASVPPPTFAAFSQTATPNAGGTAIDASTAISFQIVALTGVVGALVRGIITGVWVPV